MKFRYLFLIILLVIGGSVVFLTTSPEIKVLILLLKGEVNIPVNNAVYNGVTLFKSNHKSNLQIIIKEAKNSAEAIEIIKQSHPNFIVSAIHKPEFEKILSRFKNESEKFINIFPFYDNPMIKNLSPSFEDFSSEVVEFLKSNSIDAVNLFSDDTHITNLILTHLMPNLKNSGITVSKYSNFYLLTFNDVLKAEDKISYIISLEKGEPGLIVTIYPIRFHEFYGEYIKNLYTIFPKYFFSEEGEKFVDSFKEIFKSYPDWPSILIYDALAMINMYRKDTEKIVKYEGIAGEYNFAGNDHLFVIKKFKDLKVR